MSSAVQGDLLNAVSDREILELEKELIRIPSYTTQETELATFIVDFLNGEGIEAELQEVPIPDHARFKAGQTVSHNVVGVLRGSGDGPSLMFNGHMDHGPWDRRNKITEDFSRWKREPFEPVEENGYIYGKGAQSEKGGICAMLTAGVALKRAKVPLRGDVYLCPVMGHYTYSLGTWHMMEHGPRATYGINTENSGNRIVPKHVGMVGVEVHIHGSDPRWVDLRLLPEYGEKATGYANAIRFIQALGREGALHGNGAWTQYTPDPELPNWPTHRVDYIDKIGFDHIAVGLIVKLVGGMSEATIRRDLEAILESLQDVHSDFHAGEIRTKLWAPPLTTSAEADVVAALASCYSEVTGDAPSVGPVGRLGAIGDASIMAAAGIQTCIFGPGNETLASSDLRKKIAGELPQDESILISELLSASRVMAMTAARLCS